MMRNSHISKLIIFSLGAAVVLILPGCKDKDTKTVSADFQIQRDYNKGPLAVHLLADNSSITMAQTLQLQIQATVQSRYQAVMPDVNESLEDFHIVDWRNLGDRLDENNNVVTTYQYRLEPLKIGKAQLPSFLFEAIPAATDGAEDKKKIRLETDPVDIEVVTLFTDQPEQIELADIQDVVDMPSRINLWWIGAIALLVAAIVIFLCRRRKRAQLQKPRVYKSAHQLAGELLHRLVEANLIEKGRTKEFYQRLSNILRHYIEDRFSLMAPERTTEEFLYELQYSRSELSITDKEALAEFLNHCDLVKFAKHQPTSDQVTYTVELAEDFIAKTKSDQYRVDVTDKTENQITDPAEI